MKVAIYARYSSDNQRDASIADQFRMCRLHAEKQGWTIVEEYSDHAISGSSMIQRVDYDPAARRLIVIFCGGGRYFYHEVPSAIYEGLKEAGSAGRDAFESVFERADQALYQAKHRGRNRVELAAD